MTEVPTGSADAEIVLAREMLEAARVLSAASLHRHAVGRAYYSIFHAASALLASVGLRARTHEGLRALMNEHFVRPGTISLEHARALRQTAGDRADADYDVSARFTAEDSMEDIRRAEAFLAAVEVILPGGRDR